MKPGDKMIRESGARHRTVTIRTVGRKWVTTDEGERYHVGAVPLVHEQRWGHLYTPEAWEQKQAERADRGRLRDLLYRIGLAVHAMPIDGVRRLIAELEV